METNNIDPYKVDPYSFKWELTKPCSDCPFVKSSPLHDGIASDLPKLAEHIESGNFVHSCHKTHPGADGWNPDYKGAIQNCAGLTIMQIKNEELTIPIVRAKLSGELDDSKMDLTVDTFKDIKDMADYYVKNHVKIRFLLRNRHERN
jgi:hypothetical protein